MKKRLLIILLCATMVASTLIGCGSKETKSEPMESTEVEEQKEEVVEEPETTTPEEVVEAPESTEEPTPEAIPETNANLDIVVEVSPELQQAKDEKMPIGEETTLDFGTIIRLGDNEDYPNALEDIEIHYMDKVFQIALPKDMCVKFKSNNEAQQLDVFNQDESKRLWIFFTDFTQPVDYKKPIDLETAKNVATYYGLTILDDAEVETTINEELLIVQHIPAYCQDARYGEFIKYSIYSGEITEWEGEDGSMNSGYLGTGYYVHYGDKDTSVDPILASYIAESFNVVE